MAPAAARARLSQIIEQEPRGHVLSDQAIARRLGEEGIELSRRTVAKYREMLRIPPSHRRRAEGILVSGEASANMENQDPYRE